MARKTQPIQTEVSTMSVGMYIVSLLDGSFPEAFSLLTGESPNQLAIRKHLAVVNKDGVFDSDERRLAASIASQILIWKTRLVQLINTNPTLKELHTDDFIMAELETYARTMFRMAWGTDFPPEAPGLTSEETPNA